MLYIIWVVLVLFILIFIYSAGLNDKPNDSYIIQQKYFDRYVNNETLVSVKYVGDDICEIKQNEYTFVTISTTDNEQIKIEFRGTYILYDDFEHFNCDWEIEDIY